MKRLIFWLITIVAILGAWFTLPRNSNPIPADYINVTPVANLGAPETISLGHDIFLANCAACHGITGNGQGTTRPGFGLAPADFTDRTKAPMRTPQYLFWRVSEGGQVEPFRAQGSIMPAWKYQLSEEQRWQVIAYIQTLMR